MADSVSEAAWTSFTKKHKLSLDDGALLKALARADKTDPAKPEPRLAALEELAAQLNKQIVALAKKKKELGDKLFGEAKDKLHDLLAATEQLQKDTRAAAAAADEGDEEASSPALLTTKMVPLLRELRKGKVRMHALICTAGKNTAVLIMAKPIGPARRKLLSEAVDAAGGAKFYPAECGLEEGVLTFVLKGAAAGMAKRLRAALLAQTGLRLAVRVRGDDGALDADGENEPGADGGTPADATGGTAVPDSGTGDAAAAGPSAAALRLAALKPRIDEAVAAAHPQAAKLQALLGFALAKDGQRDAAAAAQALDVIDKLLAAPQGGAEPKAVDPGPAFTARLGALMPAIKTALAAGGPDANALKLKTSEAGALARQRDFGGAGRLLDEVEQLLESRGAPAPARPFSLVALQKARLDWDGLRKDVQAQLQQLEAAILAAVRTHNADDEAEDEYDEAEVTGGVRNLYRVLDGLDERLLDKLDEALNAVDDGERQARHAEAAALVREIQAFVQSDPLVAEIDRNGFMPTTIRTRVVETLSSLAAQF